MTSAAPIRVQHQLSQIAAIWRNIHSIPDKPITIEYDPKKDK